MEVTNPLFYDSNMRHFTPRVTILAMAVLTLTIAACTTAQKPSAQNILLYFYSKADVENATFDHPVTVSRSILSTDEKMDASLRLLFAGPTSTDEGNPFTTSDLQHLAASYRGVIAIDNVAIVDFKPEALQILNSAAARQFMAKEPIRRTLLQFPDVTDVKYSIDGKIFEEWDA